GRIADQYVREAEAVVTGEVGAIGADQLLADEREQAGTDVVFLDGGQKRGDRAPVEAAAFDRGALDHRAVGRLEAVDAGREERLERRWHYELSVCTVVLGLKPGQALGRPPGTLRPP